MSEHNDFNTHVVKTTSQWNERAVQYWVIPRGCLCVELTPDNQTKLKVGEGNKYYEQLPYVTSIEDLSDYYTKEEINIILKDLNFMSVKSTKEYDNKESLPVDGNILGDVRFVKSTDPEKKPDPDTYLWIGKWILVGNPFIDIDLSQYVKQTEFQPVKEQVDEMYPLSHWHDNKQILDDIEQPFTNADKTKLDSLHNYDDTEIRNDISELEAVAHTHLNKSILDEITQSSILSNEDRIKFDSLHNYDDTEIRNDISDIDVKVTYLENVAHTHDNKSILDRIEQPFTTADKEKLDSLHNNDVFVGTDGMFPGVAGLVPAPKVTDIGKVLSSSGAWVSASVDVFIGATADTDGTEGIVPTPMAGEQSYYLRGDGTWAKVKQGGDKYKAGDGISILSGETAADSFPFNIYSTTNSLEEYIIYGSANGVGDWNSNLQKYVITITVSSEGKQTLNYTIPLDSQLFEGDYIVYSQGIFVHYKTNLINDNESLANSGIDETGRVYIDYPSTWHLTRLSAVYEVSDEKSYLVEYDKVYSDPDWYGYYQWNINLYDASMNRTRTIRCRYTPAPFGMTPTSSEKYIRVSYPYEGDAQRYHYHFYILGENAEPISGLPRINIYSNAVNTINVTTTNKPSEIYVKIAEDEGGTTPGTDFTGIIYNEGVLDLTQENQSALNELTVHFRESSKVLTIPDNTYTLPPATTSTLGGVIVGDGLSVDNTGEISVDEMVGATSLANGSSGSVPQPVIGDETKYLKGDGTWSDPTFTLLPATTTTLGGVIVGDGLTVDGNGEIAVDISVTGYAAGDGISINPSSSLYQPVEYIESTGTQYITTDIIPNVTDKIVIDIKFGNVIDTSTGPSYNLIGVRGFVTSFTNFTDSSKDMNFFLGYAWYSGLQNYQIANPDNITTRQNLTIMRGGSVYGGKSCSANATVTITPASPIDVFGYYDDTTGSEQHVPYRGFEMYVYGIKIYDSTNTLIHDIIPVKRIIDDEPGLYDLTTETFFSNSGTGTFNVGSDQGDPVGSDDYVVSAKIDSTLSFDSNGNISVNQMTGADGSNAGTAGIVPTPTATDNTKFLKGDGTWDTPPSYSLPIASSQSLGGIKVGNNLTIDQDGVLSATGGGSSAEYIAGDGISFVGIPEYTNMNFNMSQFITTINQGWVDQGTKSTTSSTITLTNTSSQGYACYTGPYDNTSSPVYTINVSPNTEYELRYTVNDTSYDGGVEVFENLLSYNVRYRCLITGSSLTQIHRFTTTATATTLNFRLDVITQYGSITFSNIQLYELSYPPSIPRSINAKLGDGLSFDSNDAIVADHLVKEIYNNDASTSSTVSSLNFNIGDYKYLTLVYSVNGYGDFVQQIPCVATTVSNFTITYGAGPSGGGGSSTMLCGYAQISGSDGAYSLTIGHAAYSITFGSSVSVDDASTVTMYIKGLYGNS